MHLMERKVSTHFGPQLQPSMRRYDVFRVKVGNQILEPKIYNPHMKMKLPSLFETQLELSRSMSSISFLTLTHIIVTHWFKVNKIICLLDLQEIYCNSCYYFIWIKYLWILSKKLLKKVHMKIFKIQKHSLMTKRICHNILKM